MKFSTVVFFIILIDLIIVWFFKSLGENSHLRTLFFIMSFTGNLFFYSRLSFLLVLWLYFSDWILGNKKCEVEVNYSKRPSHFDTHLRAFISKKTATLLSSIWPSRLFRIFPYNGTRKKIILQGAQLSIKSFVFFY